MQSIMYNIYKLLYVALLYFVCIESCVSNKFMNL
jgi:hypothetical protein